MFLIMGANSLEPQSSPEPFHLMMMMISMGWDYVSELQPPACLLFIP
jgi:hypothetical protein